MYFRFPIDFCGHRYNSAGAKLIARPVMYIINYITGWAVAGRPKLLYKPML